MGVEIKKYKARIFGELYSITSDENEKFVASVVNTVDNYMKEISLKSSAALDSKHVAVLAALRVTQELLELQGQIEKDKCHLEKIMMLLDEEKSSLL